MGIERKRGNGGGMEDISNTINNKKYRRRMEDKKVTSMVFCFAECWSAGCLTHPKGALDLISLGIRLTN